MKKLLGFILLFVVIVLVWKLKWFILGFCFVVALAKMLKQTKGGK